MNKTEMVCADLFGCEAQASRETVRFSKVCNDVAGQFRDILKGRVNGFDLLRRSAGPGSRPAMLASPCISLPF